MNNLEMINNIFDKTKEISGHLWGNMYGPKLENTQMSHILYYLSLTAGYLKSKEEAEVFKTRWEEIKKNVEEGANQHDWLNQGHLIHAHLEQALREENIHHPKDNRNKGIARFYEENFTQLYEDAKKEYTQFQKRQNDEAEGMRKKHEEIFATQESWEAALNRGDPMALVD